MRDTRILIIAHPSSNLDSLYAVLPALIDGVLLYHTSQVGEVEGALLDCHPHLVLVDSEIGYQDARLIFELLTTQFPDVHLIILSDAAHWQRWMAVSGSHQVLLKGFSTRRLKVTLSKALPGAPTIKA